jgi:hypothetical protein
MHVHKTERRLMEARTFKIAETDLHAAEDAAKRAGVSLSEYIRAAVIAYTAGATIPTAVMPHTTAMDAVAIEKKITELVASLHVTAQVSVQAIAGAGTAALAQITDAATKRAEQDEAYLSRFGVAMSDLNRAPGQITSVITAAAATIRSLQ